MKANRKIIAIIIATLVLVAAATTGVVMYLNDDGTSRAGFDENEPSISDVNTNPGTTEENNKNNSGENAGNTENPENNNEPGNLPEAGENANQGTTANRGGTTGANANQGTTTTTGNANVPNQEYVTERVEEVERQITEDLLVGWTPLSITSAYSTNGIGIYKPDLEIVKVASTTDGNNSVAVGDALTYAMAVKNNGNEDITGLTISDVIPEQTTFIEGTIYGDGTYNKELNKIVWKVDVKAGEVVAVGFAVTVNENATGAIKNVGTIDGKNTEEVVNPVITSEKLAEVYRDKQPIEEPANIGDQIKYTIVAKNTGDVDATVVMKDTIPANTELVSPIEVAGEEIDEATMNAGKTVTVPAGETVELTFTVEVKAIEGSIKNMATVGTTTPDTETKTANLEMTKTVSNKIDGEYSKNVTLKVGETAYFKIELKNTGSEELEVTMTDIMNGADIQLYDGDKAIAQTVTVPAGTTKILTATYTMQQEDIDNQQLLKNTATATTPVTPGNEDTAEVTPEKAEPGIKVEKTAVSVTSNGITTDVINGKAPMVRAGDVITYTITVTNTGNTTLKDIEVIDTTLDVNYDNTTIKAGTPIDTISSLAPKDHKPYTVTYTVTANDIENKTEIKNAAKATGSEEVPSTPVPVNPNVTVSGTKTWEDADNQDGKRPEKITVNLLANGNKVKSQEVTAVSANSEGKWTYTFTDLPKYEKGTEITYTVTENEVDGYTTTSIEGYNITNSHTPEITSVSGTKTWVDADNQDGKRPEKITVNLLANGNKVKSQEVTAVSANSEGKWTYTFTDLPKYEKGTEITYTVTENEVDGYTTTSIEGYNITNSHTPEITSVSGTKTWVDADNQDGKRPEKITVNLLADGNKEKSQEVTAVSANSEGKWTYTFTELPKYADGKEIKYTITEEKVEGYTTNVEGYNITNTYVKPTLEINKTSNVGNKVKVGDEITYKITVKNTGKSTAKSIIVTDTVPENTTLKDGTISDDGKYEKGIITWKIDSLAVGKSKNVSFTVTVNRSADVIGKQIKNIGYVNGDKTNETTTTVSKKIAVTKKEYPAKSIDVVLVLDISSSMNENVTEEKTRIDHAKEATCKFIDEIFPEGTNGTGSTISVITFNNTSKNLGTATNYKTAETLKAKVNEIAIPGSMGTNIEAGLELTNAELDKLKNENKFVVFLGDGAPTPSFIIQEYGWQEWYIKSDFDKNTEENITEQANKIKDKTTGVYAIGVGINDLSNGREYWSHYIKCNIRNCNAKNHVIVTDNDDGTKNHVGEGFHWESERAYAKRILKEIIADKDDGNKKYYHTVNDNTQTIVDQFTKVLQSITTTTSNITAESKTVKIPITGGTLNEARNIVVKIDGEPYECKLSEISKYGLSYTKTDSEEYFTWDLTNYAIVNLEIEYTIK